MFINTKTFAYPITESEIRAQHPNTSFPAKFLPPEPYAFVKSTPQPDYDAAQFSVKESTPEKSSNGEWQQTWQLVKLSADEKAKIDLGKATQVRRERDEKLIRSDWTQLPDAALTDAQKLQWRTYRQALRDISTQAGFPWDVQWPEAPI